MNAATFAPQRWAAGLLAALLASPLGAQPIVVYRRAACDCCSQWTEHVRKHGFTPQSRIVDDVAAIRRALGMPVELASCHLAQINGYAIEGHVPADVIAQLVREQPDARGLAVPGMPPGSPGMDSPHPVAYDIWLIRHDGSATPYAQR